MLGTENDNVELRQQGNDYDGEDELPLDDSKNKSNASAEDFGSYAVNHGDHLNIVYEDCLTEENEKCGNNLDNDDEAESEESSRLSIETAREVAEAVIEDPCQSEDGVKEEEELEAIGCKNQDGGWMKHREENRAEEISPASNCEDIPTNSPSNYSAAVTLDRGRVDEAVDIFKEEKGGKDDGEDESLGLHLLSPHLGKLGGPGKTLVFHPRSSARFNRKSFAASQEKVTKVTVEEDTFTGLVVHDRIGERPQELDLKRGQYVFLTSRVNPEWYHGDTCGGRQGLIPASFVRILPQHDPSNAGVRAVAVRAHRGKPPRELLVREGDLVSVVCRVDHWWFLAEVDGARGLVPAQCIQVLRNTSLQ